MDCPQPVTMAGNEIGGPHRSEHMTNAVQAWRGTTPVLEMNGQREYAFFLAQIQLRRAPGEPGLGGQMAIITSRRYFEKFGMRGPAKTLVSTLPLCTALLVFGWAHGQFAFPSCAPSKQNQPDHLKSYRKAIPLVEWPVAELTKKMPELKGFTPADNQGILPQILQRVGANVESFFHNFMSTASVEEIHQLRMGFDGGESFNPLTVHYLLLGVTNGGETHLQEYRTNSKGKPILIGTGTGRGLLTHGFASASVYFEPEQQSLSTFRYMGRIAVEHHDFLLVAFAQRVDPRGVLARFNIQGYSIPILVQGAAWIDPASYQIKRLRTDLLAPQLTFDLDQLTTDVTYDEVHFKGVPQAMWLPHNVQVTVKYQNVTYHNEHRYSDYKLFNVEAGPKKPDSRKREEH